MKFNMCKEIFYIFNVLYINILKLGNELMIKTIIVMTADDVVCVFFLILTCHECRLQIFNIIEITEALKTLGSTLPMQSGNWGFITSS